MPKISRLFSCPRPGGWLASLILLTALFAAFTFGQGPLTNALNVMVRTDAGGNLMVYGVTVGAQGPLQNFGNIKLRTYGSGDLGVAINGGTITPAVSNAATSYQLNSVLLNSVTAPSVASGFCSSPSISNNNGNAAFELTIGTGCGGSTGTLTLPAAAHAWKCDFVNVTTPASNIPDQTGGSTTTVTVTNYARTTGLAANFTDSHVIRASCVAY